MTLNLNIKKELKNFDLDVNFISNSKSIGLLGASGAGKTQILKSIAGLNSLKSGYIKHNENVFYDSENKINLSPKNRQIGYLFQNYALFPHMSVKEQIYLTSKRDDIDSLCEKFRINHLLNSKPSRISGGESQRVAMVRMLASDPKIILLDEPFSALDINLKLKLRLEVKEMLKDFDGTFVIVSHDLDDLMELCDEIAFIEKGRLLKLINVNDLGKNLDKDVARLIGFESFMLDDEQVYYNPKAFSFIPEIGALKFEGEVISIVNSINYKIVTIRCFRQNIRIETSKNSDILLGNNIVVYQNIVK